MRLRIDRMSRDDTELLGPGKRAEIWLHGCERNCPGCITEKVNHAPEPMLDLSVETVMSYIQQQPDTEGVTISGGEPLLQSQAVYELVHRVQSNGMGVILYTGYLFDEIPTIPYGTEILHHTDVCIDGPYVQELDDGKAFRGSSNQQIHHITNRYRNYFENVIIVRQSIIVQQGAYFTLTGIPTDESKSLWNLVKQKENKNGSNIFT